LPQAPSAPPAQRQAAVQKPQEPPRREEPPKEEPARAAENDSHAAAGQDDAAFRKGLKEASKAMSKPILSTIDEMEAALCLAVLNDPKHDETSQLHRAIHNMRFNPGYFNTCGIDEMQACEMALAAHSAFVAGKENRWQGLSSQIKRDVEEYLKKAASHMEGSTVKEREALALEAYPEIREMRDKLDVYVIRAKMTEHMFEAFVQMDNSLKKMIDRWCREYQNTRG
jgi:hypothetical protein